MTDTQKLLNFIISQELELEDYHKLESPIWERFQISQDGRGEFVDTIKGKEWRGSAYTSNATDKLIAAIIEWESGTSRSSSLEAKLNSLFYIHEWTDDEKLKNKLSVSLTA